MIPMGSVRIVIIWIASGDSCCTRHGGEARRGCGGRCGRIRPIRATSPTASGKAIYLTGSHTWANLQDQGCEGSAADVRLRPLSRFPPAAPPQLHPPVGVGAGPLGAVVRRQRQEPQRLVHRAESLCPDRPGLGPRRQAQVRPVEVRPGLFRPPAQSGSTRRASGASMSR